MQNSKLSKKQLLTIIGLGLGLILLIALISLITKKPENLDTQQQYDNEFEQGNAEYFNNYPIIEYLPIETEFYKIGYGACENTNSDFCVAIEANFGSLYSAIHHAFTIPGINQYIVEVSNYTNPFTATPYELTTTQAFEDANTSGMLSRELSGIKTALSAKLSTIDATYSTSINQLKLFGVGNYCGATIKITNGQGISDTFRAILEKINGTWQLVTNIDIFIDPIKNPNLSADLIYKVNQL